MVYQVYPRSFADSDGDGVGDLRGIIDHLDHLELLGVDVVWLSPVYTSPMADNGYDISDYQDVDPLFGTMAGPRRADRARPTTEGMKLVMDLVVNHTSSAHAWFQESRQPRTTRSATGTGGGRRATARSRRTGSRRSPGRRGRYDERTGEYYLHLFAPEQPDLNWENPEVRQAVYAMMRWWLDRGVDGFRMDVINHLSKVINADGTLPDGAMREGARFGDKTPYVVNGPRMHEFLHEMHQEVFAGRPPGLITIGEMPACPLEEAILYTDPAREELDMVFQFEHVDLDSGPGGKWDIVPMTLLDLKRSLGRSGRTGSGREGLEQPVPRQPRPAALRQPLRQRQPGAPGAVGQGARDRAAPPARHAVRLRGRRARAAERRLHPHRPAPRHRVAQLLRRGRRRRPAARRRHGRPLRQGPRQRARPDAVDRGEERRLHDRYAVARRPPPGGDDQRGGPGRRSGLGLQPLPAADRAAPPGEGGLARDVHHAGARRRAGLRVRPRARGHARPGRRQPVGRRRGDGRRRSRGTTPSSPSGRSPAPLLPRPTRWRHGSPGCTGSPGSSPRIPACGSLR